MVAKPGLTHFLLSVGGEKLALVAKSRLRLFLLCLLAGEGTAGYRSPLLKGRVLHFPRHSAAT